MGQVEKCMTWHTWDDGVKWGCSVVGDIYSMILDLTIGWQNLNLLSQPNATLAPQIRQARPSGEISNYLLSRKSDILIISLPLL